MSATMRYLALALLVTACAWMPSARAEIRTRFDSQQLQINGVPLLIKRETAFTREGVSPNLDIRVVLNLGDLPAKMGAILPTLGLPTNNCRSYSTSNFVVSATSSELKLEKETGVAIVRGISAIWDCRENPVPNSKIEWQVENIGFGVKTKVPKVVTSPGSPIKTKIAEASFSASYVLEPKPQGNGVEIKVSYSTNFETDLATRFTGFTEIMSQIGERLGISLKQIVAIQLTSVLPVDFRVLDMTVKATKFVKEADALGIQVEFSVNVPNNKVDSVNNFLDGLVRTP